MKLIIAGCRNVSWDYFFTLRKESIQYIVDCATKSGDWGIIIVSGEATGIDTLGKSFAYENGFHVESFPANWNKYGKRAGFIRNKQMGDYATHLIAFWDGKSRGTKNMIDYMKSLNKPVKVILLKEEEI